MNSSSTNDTTDTQKKQKPESNEEGFIIKVIENLDMSYCHTLVSL